MVRHGLPIVTVVVNNSCWGMSLHGQDLLLGAGEEIITRLADTDYDRVATAFGAFGERVRQYEDIGPAVKRALADGRPACINLAQARSSIPSPRCWWARSGPARRSLSPTTTTSRSSCHVRQEAPGHRRESPGDARGGCGRDGR